MPAPTSPTSSTRAPCSPSGTARPPRCTAEDDIDRATELALQMVGRYGMSPHIGFRRILSKFDGVDGDGPRIEPVSGQTLNDFDKEVGRVIQAAHDKASEMLVAHRRPLQEMVARLEEEETLEGPALAALLARVSPEMTPAAEQTPAGARQGLRQRTRRPAPPS